jgi:tRNA(Ile)-lysidine synthase
VPVAELARPDIFSSLTGLNRVAVAVSGGSDSMAMLRMVHEWAGDRVQIFALSVDHGLRTGSADELARVQHWCAALGVAHKILHWEGAKPVTGIQAKARSTCFIDGPHC